MRKNSGHGFLDFHAKSPKISVTFPPPVMGQLCDLATSRGVSTAAIIRQAVVELLAREGGAQ